MPFKMLEIAGESSVVCMYILRYSDVVLGTPNIDVLHLLFSFIFSKISGY